MELRRKEADDFYRLVLPQHVSADEKLVMRQGFAGMLWSKQFYHYDLERWLTERNVPKDQEDNLRNSGWFHMLTRDVISMPDKWSIPGLRLGPRVSHATARHGRSCVCEEPVEADAEQLLLASKWPTARLRMELRRW